MRPAPQPFLGRGLDDRVDAEHQSRGDQAPRPECPRRRRSRCPSSRSSRRSANSRGRDPDRDVHEEDPVPVDRLRDHAAGEQADRAAGGGHERVHADRLRLLARLGEHRHDHSQDHRRGHRAADALHEASADSTVWLCARPHSSDAAVNTRHTDQEDAPAPDQVAEAPRQQQQAAERDQVSVHDPREARGGEAAGRPGSTAARRSRPSRRARSSASPRTARTARPSGCRGGRRVRRWRWRASARRS